jgi:hypothetical protein
MKYHNFYSSPNIIIVTKSKEVRWPGHATRIKEMRNVYKISAGKFKGRGHLEDTSVDGKID